MRLCDKYSDCYGEADQQSINFSGLQHAFFLEAKANLLRALVGVQFSLNERPNLLDVGCGVGEMHAYLAGTFKEIYGVDVSEASIAQARDRHPANDYRAMVEGHIPHPRGTFDVVTAICVLHHVESERWPGFLAELTRVARPGGFVCIIEHNPFNPLTQLAVMRCPFDKDARLLRASWTRRLMEVAGLDDVAVRHFLLFPFMSAPTEWVERRLECFPFGAQYIVTGRRSLDEASHE